MRTSEEIYHRVRWDPRFDPARFTLGVSRREGGIKRVALPEFVPGGEIPWHRIMLIEADEEVVWDRVGGVDRIDVTRAGRVAAVRVLRAPSIRACVPHRYDASAGSWRPVSAAAATPTSSVRVLTWNTLWDRYDAEQISTHLRRPMLLDTLRAADADVIALQEVEPLLLAMLACEGWIREGYMLCTDPAKSDVDEDGLVVLSRLPILESGRCVLGPYKAALAITVTGPSGPLVVVATHLTSNHSVDAATRRAAELTELAGAFGGVDADLIIMGDFNDSTTGPEGPAAVLGLRDVWNDVHGAEDTTPTFDPTVNPLAAVSSLTGRSGRLDRILIRPRAGGLEPGATVLVGDVPDATGLYASDHFGISADLIGVGAATSTSVEFAPPTARTALAWIPPRDLWPALNELRERYDPQVKRWPPHVNVLFGFVPEYEFERAAALLSEAAAQIKPFTARLDGVETFGHRDDATIWLDPAASDPEPWAALHREFQQRFPNCHGRDEGYTPHLTLGRSDDPHRVAALCATRLTSGMSAQVGTLALLSRRGDEPMHARAEIELGTGHLRWLPEPAPAPVPADDDSQLAQRLVSRIGQALAPGIVHVVGSRRMGCALPGADVDLIAVLPGAVDTVDPAAIQSRLTAALPEAIHVRQVIGARVPGLRMTVGELSVDLVIIQTGTVDPAEAVERRAELGEAAATALSAVSDAEAVLRHVGADHAAFTTLARQVKTWAAARGLDSAPFGGLPGLAWSVLAARTTTSGEATLARFFEQWAAWNWHEPVTLTDEDAAPASSISILTPTAPIRSCTTQVGPALRDLLVEELYRAWEITQETASIDLHRLCEPPPLHRRHAAWARVTIQAGLETAFDDIVGRTRGRIRALITELEALSPSNAVHAWPRLQHTSGVQSATYVIGLGQSPFTRQQLADVATRWTSGLPGVSIDWLEGGAALLHTERSADVRFWEG